ncbi:MAG: ribokinase [Tunicatimonas sp.]
MQDKIVVIGSSNVDLIMKMERLPERGETITDADFVQTYGGKGANQAVAAARAGGQVTFVNCVGDDAYTPPMVQNFRDDGIDTRYVFSESGIASGHALVMIGEGGNNYLSVAPGANYRLTPDKLASEAPEVLDDAAMVLMQYEIPADTIRYVLEEADRRGIPVLWNFAPARSFDLSYLARVHTLVVNEVEAEFLSGEAVRSADDAERAAQQLRQQGVQQVIVTLGERGAYFVGEQEAFYTPALAVDQVDTTAAGDTFCGALAVALTEQQSLPDAVRFACAAAALAVTRLGAQPSIPQRTAVEELLKRTQ